MIRDLTGDQQLVLEENDLVLESVDVVVPFSDLVTLDLELAVDDLDLPLGVFQFSGQPPGPISIDLGSGLVRLRQVISVFKGIPEGIQLVLEGFRLLVQLGVFLGKVIDFLAHLFVDGLIDYLGDFVTHRKNSI